jgi:DNA-binding CsgD family transcriptional regulator/tetratricopeptide (TPR) repeat protein
VLPNFLANMLFVRGLVAEDQEDFALAERLHTEAADLYRAAGEPDFVGYALTGLGVVANHRGEAARAGQLFSEALALEQAAGNAFGIGLVLTNLGRLARDRGEYDTAADHYRESLRLRMEHGNLIGVVGPLRGLASVAAACQQWERATCLYAAADALAGAIGHAVPPPVRARYDQALGRLQAALGEARFQVVWSEGYAMTPDQAVAQALATGPCARPSATTVPSTRSVAATSLPQLTERERAVLHLLVEGQSSREIAAALFISHRTVTTHVTNILNKLGVNSRAAAVAAALRHELV